MSSIPVNCSLSYFSEIRSFPESGAQPGCCSPRLPRVGFAWLFVWLLGTQSWVLLFAWKAHYQLSQLSSFLSFLLPSFSPLPSPSTFPLTHLETGYFSALPGCPGMHRDSFASCVQGFKACVLHLLMSPCVPHYLLRSLVSPPESSPCKPPSFKSPRLLILKIFNRQLFVPACSFLKVSLHVETQHWPVGTKGSSIASGPSHPSTLKSWPRIDAPVFFSFCSSSLV